MSSEGDNYDEEGFDSQPQPDAPQPQPQPQSQPASPTAPSQRPPSTSKPPSRDTPTSPLTLPSGATSPLAVSAHPSTATNRTSRSSRPVKSPKASARPAASTQSSANKSKAAALLAGASNPSLVIQQLQDWNDQLTQQTTEQSAHIQQLEQSVAELDSSASHHQRALDDAASQLQQLTAQHAALKTQHTASLTSIARLEATNVDLLTSQLKEKNQRIDLEGRLTRCETALKRERDDCARLKAERREREVAHRVEAEQWEQEKRGWRETNVDLLTKVEALDDAIKHHKQTEAALQHDVASLQAQLSAREAELARVNEELVTAIRRANEHADAALAAQTSITRLEEQAAERGQVVLELERVVKEQKEVMRGQSDRITSVVFQMGRMDEWKVVKEEEEREKAAVMIEMRGVVESQEKAMNSAIISKERSDSMIGILEDRLGKEGKRVQDMRDKQAELERSMKGVVQALREKEAEFDHLSIKLSHVASKWSQEQALREAERKVADGVERRSLEQRAQLDELLLERQRLEDDKVVKEELLRDQQQQLDGLKQKDEYYRKVQEALASSNVENSEALLALLTSSNERFVRYTNPVSRGKLKTALLTSAGHRVKAALRRCDVDPKELLDWCIEPQRLVDGLSSLLQNIKQLRNVDAFASSARSRPSSQSDAQPGVGGAGGDAPAREGLEREVELLHARNAELNQAVVKAEADKSKALMRLVTLCTGPAPTSSPSAAPASQVGGQAADGTFITAVDAGEADVRGPAPPSSTPAEGADHLVLSEMGLTDSHVALIAPHVRRSREVRELDLRGNALSNPSAVSLIDACLDAGNKVHMIDLQQNLVTLDGLEDVALAIMRRARGQGGDTPILLGASLYKQGATLLPILQLRLPHKLLLVDLRYNRLQHIRPGGSAPVVPGESVKQRMKRVLLRVCRLLNSVGGGGDEASLAKVDWDARTPWMTDAEVSALISANSQRKAEDDRRREEQTTAFDTHYEAGQVRRTSGLEAKNVKEVRPVLPPPPRKRASGGLPRIGTGEGTGRAGSRRGSAGGKVEEEMKVQEEVAPVQAAVAEPVEQVEGGVEAGEDYEEDWSRSAAASVTAL